MLNNALYREAAQETSAAFSGWWIDAEVDMLYETVSNAEPMKEFRHSLERAILNQDINIQAYCKRIQGEATAYPSKFLQSTAILLPYLQLFLRSFKNSHEILILNKGEIKIEKHTQSGLVEGSSDDDWTVADWVFDSDQQCMLDINREVEEIKSELSCLLECFKQGKPIERPASLLETAEQVANQYYENEQKNIDEWAEKLAEDLSKLSD